MTKKIHYFLRYFKVGEWIFPWLNIAPSSFPNRNCSWGRAGRFSSLWFFFGLWPQAFSSAIWIHAGVTIWVVDVILLQIGLKCFSMRMTLDLLHKFADAKVLCLFHNCMWQSRHSEVNVYFLALCEQTGGLSTFNQSPRACLICVYVFVCVFVVILTFNGHWHTTVHRSPRAYSGAFAAKQDTFVDFLSKRTGWKNWVQKLLEEMKTPNKPNQKTKNPIVRTERLVKSEQPSNCLWRKFPEELEVTHILSRKWFLHFSIMIAFGIQ